MKTWFASIWQRIAAISNRLRNGTKNAPGTGSGVRTSGGFSDIGTQEIYHEVPRPAMLEATAAAAMHSHPAPRHSACWGAGSDFAFGGCFWADSGATQHAIKRTSVVVRKVGSSGDVHNKPVSLQYSTKSSCLDVSFQAL